MHFRSWMALTHDIVAAMFAWYLAYWLRFNTEIPAFNVPNMLGTMLWVVPLQAAIFFACGMYRGMWRYASLPDLQRIALAVGLSILAIALVLVLLPHEDPPVPRSVVLLDPILLILFLGGSRLAYRVWQERRLSKPPITPGKRSVILGAGDTGADLLKNLARAGDLRVLGLLDDDPAKRGRQIHGVNVLGPLEKLVELAPRLALQQAIIAMPSASPESRRRALEICRQAGVQALTVPSYQDLVSGTVAVSQLRSIEIDELLGRDPAPLDEPHLREWISGKRVLVTGDGGAIGTELCRQIARFDPSRLVLFEHSEFALYRMEQEFAELHPGIDLCCIRGDVKNAASVAKALDEHRPEIVFHAAAYKHAPLIEQHDAWESVQNNVLGTWHVAVAALDHGVKKFVMCSADRGGEPTDVMGASKRLAEIVCRGLQARSQTKFIVVRCGNFLESSGAIIQKLREQIARGGPITIAHADMTHHFMSFQEAARLLLQAGLMGEGGETYALDAGEPAKIVELAREYVRLAGYAESDIAIEFTGLTPSEKLSEELPGDADSDLPTRYRGLRSTSSPPQLAPAWMDGLSVWLKQGNPGTEQARQELVQKIFSLAEAAGEDR